MSIATGLQKALVAERRKRQAAEMESWIRKAYAAYRKDSDISADILSATKAGFGGSNYYLELLPSGDHRVLWDGEIGNQYESPGILVRLPQLGDDDWDECGDHDFSSAIDALDWDIEDFITEQQGFILNGDNECVS